MSKQFRTATQTRRGVRGGFPEHDDFEGLPVRQWRQEWVSVAPPPASEMTQQNDRWAIELPFGVPKDFPLLPPHSQELLRAARSGRLYKRPAPAEEEEVEAEVPDPKNEKKETDITPGGYTVKMWKQMPRNADTPTISHLAKRHKHTVTLSSKAMAPQITGPTVRRVTVRRTDATGNPYERTVTLADGQTVDGEIISETIVPAPVAAAGGDLTTEQPAPARRRPPPPKRKAKGPGRGRKKGKLPLPVPIPRSQPEDGSEPVKAETTGTNGVKIEENEDSTNQDSEMADASAVASEDDEGDENDDGEDDNDGDEAAGDEGGGDATPDVENSSGQDPDQDHEMEDSDASEVIRPSSIEEPEEPQPAPSEDDITITKPRFPPPALGGLGPLHLPSPRLEGSPLKNVIIQSPTDPSPMVSPRVGSTATSFSATGYMDVHGSSMSMDAANASVVTGVAASEVPAESESFADQVQAPSELDFISTVQSEPVDHTMGESHSPTAALAIEDFVGDNTLEAPATPIPAAPEAAPEQPHAPPTLGISEPPPDPVLALEADPIPDLFSETTLPEAQVEALQPPDSPALRPASPKDDDDGLNLLGSLERELDRQERMSNAGSTDGQKLTPPTASPTGLASTPLGTVGDENVGFGAPVSAAASTPNVKVEGGSPVQPAKQEE